MNKDTSTDINRDTSTDINRDMSKGMSRGMNKGMSRGMNKGVNTAFNANAEYERLFAVNFYKNKKLHLAEMSFTKPLTSPGRGDAYPVMSALQADFSEAGTSEADTWETDSSETGISGDQPENCGGYVKSGKLIAGRGREARFFCRYFPYATYELQIETFSNEAQIEAFSNEAQIDDFSNEALAGSSDGSQKAAAGFGFHVPGAGAVRILLVREGEELSVRMIDDETGTVLSSVALSEKIGLGTSGNTCPEMNACMKTAMYSVTNPVTKPGTKPGMKPITKRGMKFLVTARKHFFDVYIDSGSMPEFVTTFSREENKDIIREDVFSRSYVTLETESGSGSISGNRSGNRSGSINGNRSGNGNSNSNGCIATASPLVISAVSSYMDCGISQADLRAVRYENGDVLEENGRVFITFSARMAEGAYQGVFSWVPGTLEFELTGAIFFDAGDDCWQNDVATCLVRDRRAEKWILWVCSFSHDHVLGQAVFEGEVRYGVNVVDIELMPTVQADEEDTADKNNEKESGDTAFLGKPGDEDPCLIYDEASGCWRLAVCRLMTEHGETKYKYVFFQTDKNETEKTGVAPGAEGSTSAAKDKSNVPYPEHPLQAFKYTGCTAQGEGTGGSFVVEKGVLHFVCGAEFKERACYRDYIVPNFDTCARLTHDMDDGGFRGWGTLISLKRGTRTETWHLTFDRSLGSSYNWSYGTVYCFKRI